MSTPHEAAAKAAYNADNDPITPWGSRRYEWDDMLEEGRERYRIMSLAVIEALREGAESRLEAWDSKVGPDDDVYNYRHEIIDAILGPKKES